MTRHGCNSKWSASVEMGPHPSSGAIRTEQLNPGEIGDVVVGVDPNMDTPCAPCPQGRSSSLSSVQETCNLWRATSCRRARTGAPSQFVRQEGC